jgi:hypothetical protein
MEKRRDQIGKDIYQEGRDPERSSSFHHSALEDI